MALVLCAGCVSKQPRPAPTRPSPSPKNGGEADDKSKPEEVSHTTPTREDEGEVDTSAFPRMYGMILVMEPADALSPEGAQVVQTIKQIEEHFAKLPEPPFPIDRDDLTREEGRQLSEWYSAYYAWQQGLRISQEAFNGPLGVLAMSAKADEQLVHFIAILIIIDAYQSALRIEAPVQSFGCSGQSPETTLFEVVKRGYELARALSEVPPRSPAVKHSADAIAKHKQRVDALMLATIKLDDHCDMQAPMDRGP